MIDQVLRDSFNTGCVHYLKCLGYFQKQPSPTAAPCNTCKLNPARALISPNQTHSCDQCGFCRFRQAVCVFSTRNKRGTLRST